MIFELSIAAGLIYLAVRAKNNGSPLPVEGGDAPTGVQPSPARMIGPPLTNPNPGGTGIVKPPPRPSPIGEVAPPHDVIGLPPTVIDRAYGGGGATVGRIDSIVARTGGGGPENQGAKAKQSIPTPLPSSQPSWHHESDSEYFGHARRSNVPLTAGGGNGQPADAFRWLGDNFGSRS